MKYSYNPPFIFKKIFHEWKWDTSNNKILLTFDDGPIPETTPLILNSLDNSKTKAIFFCVGNNVIQYPDLVKEILNRGHEVGNHTMNHKRITKLFEKELSFEIDTFNQIMEDKFNYKTKYFRPPHGRFNLITHNELKKRNLINIMWSLLTRDYKNDFNLVKFAVDNYLNQDSIIVLHDSLKSKGIVLDSIKYILDKVNENGFEIGEPAECLK